MVGSQHHTGTSTLLCRSGVLPAGSFGLPGLISVVIVLVSAVLQIMINEPRWQGDTSLYIEVAKNIFEYGCYSDDIVTDDCTSNFISTKAPGYSIFVALSYFLGGQSTSTVLVSQSLAYALSVILLILSLRGTGAMQVATATLLSFSPATFAWSSILMPEYLSAATTILVAASLVRSVRRGRLDVLAVSLAIAAAVIVRREQVFLLVAVCVVGLSLMDWRTLLKALAPIGISAGIGLFAWQIPAAVKGEWEQPSYLYKGDRPSGVIDLWRATALSQESASQFLWPIWNKQYSTIESAAKFHFSPSVEPDLGRLMEQASRLTDGGPFPSELDENFATLANSFQRNNPVEAYVLVPLTRATLLWTRKDTVTSYGWNNLILANIAHIYTLLVISAALIFWPMAILLGDRAAFLPLTAALLTTTVRTAILVSISLTAIELRYLVPIMPSIEVAVAISIVSFWRTIFRAGAVAVRKRTPAALTAPDEESNSRSA
ncbi:hypothetical protein [Kaistia terrae]|uniref:Glycosyltransferase RgtA/B/C/D-like domain-containing protein n=1 Tax=Kaistia terrae TaxID=537017 RepID=A0ABW0Q3H8_9HYPH|nr:hypothetical protein [Kaistia terrae]MCX5581305.1 hypothetical protein [Kaistia terrae]